MDRRTLEDSSADEAPPWCTMDKLTTKEGARGCCDRLEALSSTSVDGIQLNLFGRIILVLDSSGRRVAARCGGSYDAIFARTGLVDAEIRRVQCSERWESTF